MNPRTRSRGAAAALALLASAAQACHAQPAPANATSAPSASASGTNASAPPPAGAASTAVSTAAVSTAPASPGAVSTAPASTGAVSTAATGDGAAAAGPSAADEWIGKPAPDFTAVAQDGSVVHLAELRGKAVVVYFYPKDETPGCTKEACSFRDAWQALAATGAVLIGISADDRASHVEFARHYKLPFRLVSDPDGAIGRSYGVPFHGVHRRQTFVIGSDGTVRKVYRNVDVSVHAQQVLGDLAHPS